MFSVFIKYAKSTQHYVPSSAEQLAYINSNNIPVLSNESRKRYCHVLNMRSSTGKLKMQASINNEPKYKGEREKEKR